MPSHLQILVIKNLKEDFHFFLSIEWTKQDRIHGTMVADGWAAAVMQKTAPNSGLGQMDRWTC